MPGQACRTRQQQIINYQANSLVVSNPLGLGYLYREMAFKLSGTIQSTGSTYTSSTLKGGDEWGVIQKLEIVVNGGDVIRSLTGEQLNMMNAFWYDRPRRPSFTTASSSSAFASTLILPFWDQWGREPLDTLLDSSKLSELKVQVTWGNPDSISTGTGTGGSFTVAPTLAVSSRESFGLNPAIKYQVARQFQITNASSVAAQDEYTVLLPLGNIFKGFWINTKDSSGNDLAGCIDRVKLQSGTLNYIDMDMTTLRDWYNLRAGIINGVIDTTRVLMPMAISSKTLVDGWTYIALVDDGYTTEAIDTYTLSELKLIFKTNQTIATFTIIPDMIVPVRG
jgi:hypothetical protein